MRTKKERAAQKKAWAEHNREKNRKNQAAWYQSNREKVLARVKAHAKRNTKKIAAYNKDWERKNSEKVAARKRQDGEKNRGKYAVLNAKRYQNNREEVKARTAQWAKNNPDRHKALHNATMARRRARKRGTAVKNCPLVAAIYSVASRLRSNGEDVHVDHVIPLSRGGTHTHDNLQILTAQKNLSKGAKLP